MKILKGVEERVVRKWRGEEGEEEDRDEEEIRKEEWREAIKRLKEGKAAEIDEIPNEI